MACRIGGMAIACGAGGQVTSAPGPRPPGGDGSTSRTPQDLAGHTFPSKTGLLRHNSQPNTKIPGRVKLGDDLQEHGHRARVESVTDEAIAALAPRIGTRAACAASGVPQATWYRRHRISYACAEAGYGPARRAGPAAGAGPGRAAGDPGRAAQRPV